MTPTNYDLTIYQGSTLRETFTWLAGDTPTAVDLTGCQLRMQVRESKDSTTALLELTTANGGILMPTPSSGSFTLYASATTTAALNFTKALYDLEVTFSTGDVVRFMEGRVILSKEVTR